MQCAALRTAPDVELDARGCSKVDAFAIASLALAIAARRIEDKPAVKFRDPTDPEAARLFARIEFRALCEGNSDWQPKATYEARQLRAYDPAYVDRLTEGLAEEAGDRSEVVKHAVELCLHELLTNTFDHSHSEIGCVVVGFVEGSSIVDLAVADAGIGIPEALRRSLPSLAIHPENDSSLVVRAVTSGLTSRPGRRGGLGFGNIRQQVAMRGGVLTLRSLPALASFGAGLLAQGSEVSFWNGTVVHARVDLSQPLDDLAGDTQMDVF